MTMIGRLARFCRRQLHTIVSREIIKPSFPTPSHLKTYNLSLLDQTNENIFVPMVAFFPNNHGTNHSSHDQVLDLKNSLSETLTKYYPFAGRYTEIAPAQVDCNDDGAEFLVASIDSTLKDFIQHSQHEDLNQFFPYNQVWSSWNHRGQSNQVIPLSVQVNYFQCGGVAVAVSLSHKIADASSLAQFLYDWAKMTRICLKGQKHAETPIDPQFLSFPNININFDGFSLWRSKDCVTRSFLFPSSKINDLKQKVIAMTAKSRHPITNPTRVEVLNWLLYKSALTAANKNKSGFSKPTGLGHIINIRDKMLEVLPKNSIGNMVMTMKIFLSNESDLKTPEAFINELKKQKIKVRGLQNIKSVFDFFSNMSSEADLEEQQRIIHGAYICTSICGYPTHDEIDFGWGKPIKATFGGNLCKNSFILMDAPNRDGIEALVCLEKEEMAIIQTDPELLDFC